MVDRVDDNTHVTLPDHQITRLGLSHAPERINAVKDLARPGIFIVKARTGINGLYEM
jgi:hypothetical protein